MVPFPYFQKLNRGKVASYSVSWAYLLSLSAMESLLTSRPNRDVGARGAAGAAGDLTLQILTDKLTLSQPE